MTRLPLHLVALATLVLSSAAWADRPLVSETADVMPTGDCQIETSLARTRIRGQPSATGLDTLLTCGVAWQSQIGLDLATVKSGGANTASGGLQGKTRLVALQDGQTGLALAYGLTWDKPAGAGWAHGSTSVFGVASRQLTQALLGHLNLGWLRIQSERLTSTTWSLGMEGEGAVRWVADVFGDDRARPWGSAGVIFPIADKVSANLAYAAQFKAPNLKQLTLGFKFEF